MPFMQDPYPEVQEDDEDDPDHAEILKKMVKAVPPTSIFLGRVDNEINDRPGYTWREEDHYYLVPFAGDVKRWALIRIHWDDNYSRWEWSMDATGSGFNNAKEAARVLVTAMFNQWSIDPSSEEYEHYGVFLKRLR